MVLKTARQYVAQNVITRIELPSRRKITAVNLNLSSNNCFVLSRAKST